MANPARKRCRGELIAEPQRASLEIFWHCPEVWCDRRDSRVGTIAVGPSVQSRQIVGRMTRAPWARPEWPVYPVTEEATVAALAERITVNPDQCGGRPCVRGLRIRVTDVLDLLASRLSPEQVLDELRDRESDLAWSSHCAARLSSQRP